MKKKYYYDCPIQALYMMREFDVKFLHWIYPSIHKTEMELLPVGIYYLENIIPYFNYKYAFEHRFIVAPESEYIFEPKEGDIGICGKLLIPVKFDIKDWVPSKMLKKETYYEIKETLFVKTVYRNGKHFFMPKEEN